MNYKECKRKQSWLILILSLDLPGGTEENKATLVEISGVLADL
jgi:hypothetical protein